MVSFPQDGGCYCGDVRYTLAEAPIVLYACLCTNCQRQTGSSFSLNMRAKLDAIEVVRGDPGVYDLRLPDGKAEHFKGCSRCCTRIWSEHPTDPGFGALRAGTLDDTSWLHPVGHIWTRGAQPWISISDA